MSSLTTYPGFVRKGTGTYLYDHRPEELGLWASVGRYEIPDCTIYVDVLVKSLVDRIFDPDAPLHIVYSAYLPDQNEPIGFDYHDTLGEALLAREFARGHETQPSGWHARDSDAIYPTVDHALAAGCDPTTLIARYTS